MSTDFFSGCKTVDKALFSSSFSGAQELMVFNHHFGRDLFKPCPALTLE